MAIKSSGRKRIILFLVGLFVIVFSWLKFFANPQHSSWIYCLQAYHWPERNLRTPEGYDGVWREWDYEGVLQDERVYIKGRCFSLTQYKGGNVFRKYIGLDDENEIQIMFWPNGIPKTFFILDDGIVSGTAYSWHENGSLSSRGLFAEGEEAGLWQNWRPNGKLLRETHYVEGKMNGVKLEWDNKGYCAEALYQDDKPVKGIVFDKKFSPMYYLQGKRVPYSEYKKEWDRNPNLFKLDK